MLNVNQLLIDHFEDYLISGYIKTYGDWKMDYGQIVAWAASIATQIHSNLGDAPYHGLEHTIDVTVVGLELLHAYHIVDRVTPEEWMHVLVACAFHDIGYVKLLLPEDKLENYPRGSSGAVLTEVHVDRGKEFVKQRFSNHKIINADILADFIEQTRFPIPEGERYQETRSLRGLVRAADFIGQLANLHHYQQQRALYYEFAENGTNQRLGYDNVDDLREAFPSFFFNVVKPYIRDGVAILQRTETGRVIINSLFANVFRAQHPEFGT